LKVFEISFGRFSVSGLFLLFVIAFGEDMWGGLLGPDGWRKG